MVDAARTTGSARQPAPVTVLMSTYNRAHFLPEALDGILNQTRPPRQVIVVNDGSSDATATVLAGYGDRLQCIERDNRGKSASLNEALRKAEQPYIWIFDDDDVPFPDALDRHLALLEATPEAGFTFSPYVAFRSYPDGGGRQIVREQEFTAHQRTYVFSALLEECFFTQQGSLVRRSSFLEAGDYDEALTRSLDYDFLLRLAWSCRGVALDSPTFYLRVHEGDRGVPGDRFPAQQKAERWFQAHRAIFERLYRRWPLCSFALTPVGRQAPDPCDTFDATLRRAAVMAGNGAWDAAIADFAALGTVGRVAGLTSEQARLAYNILSSAYVLRALASDRALRTRLYDSLDHPVGHDILRMMVRKIAHNLIQHPEMRTARTIQASLILLAEPVIAARFPSVISQAARNRWLRCDARLRGAAGRDSA